MKLSTPPRVFPLIDIHMLFLIFFFDELINELPWLFCFSCMWVCKKDSSTMQSSDYLCWKEGPPHGEPHFCFVTQNLRGLAIQYIVKILEILQIWQCNRSRTHSIAELCKVQEAHKEQHYINKSLSSVLSKSWWFWQIMEFMHSHAHTHFPSSYRMNMWSL